MTTAPQPTLTERVFSAAAWNTMLFPVKFVFGLIANVLMLAYLHPSEYGIFILIISLAATVGLYSDLGIERSLPRFIPEVENQEGRAGVARFLCRIISIKLMLVLAFIVGIQLFATPLLNYIIVNEQRSIVTAEAELVDLRERGAPADEIVAAEADIDGRQGAVEQLEETGRLFLWAVCALAFFGAIYDVFMQYLTAYFKQRAWNIITAVVTLLQPLLIIMFIALNMRLGGVLLGIVITPVIAVALAAWQTLRASRELAPTVVDAQPDPTMPRRFAGFAGMSFLTQMTTWFYDLAFVVIVLTAAGTSLANIAILGFAYTFAKTFLSYAYLPFGGLLTPLLTRIRNRNEAAALQETYGSMTRMFALILIPAGVGLALLTPRLLGLLYPQYVDAANLAYVLIGFAFLESLLSIPHNVLMVYDRYRAVLIARLLALIVVPLLLIVAQFEQPEQVLMGVAIAVGVARVLPRLVTLIVVRRTMGLRFPVRFVGRVVLAVLAFCIPLLLLQQVWPLPADTTTWADKALAATSLGALAALVGIGYLVALRLLGGLDEQERKRILGLKLPFKRVLARIL